VLIMLKHNVQNLRWSACGQTYQWSLQWSLWWTAENLWLVDAADTSRSNCIQPQDLFCFILDTHISILFDLVDMYVVCAYGMLRIWALIMVTQWYTCMYLSDVAHSNHHSLFINDIGWVLEWVFQMYL